MDFLFALLRRKGSGERQRAGSNPLSATSAPGSGGAGSISAPLEQGRETSVPTVAKGMVHSDSVENGVWTEPHTGRLKSGGNATLMEVKRATAHYPDDITRAAHVFAGSRSMPHVHLAPMGDGEVWFPGHPCTAEPAEVSGFHGLQWLGRTPTTTAVQLPTPQDYILHPSAKQPLPK